jgi:hypothetical protein
MRPENHPTTYDFDTDHSIRVVDVEIKITKAGSGLDPS